MGTEMRESCLLPPFVRGRVFTQYLTHKFTHLSIYLGLGQNESFVHVCTSSPANTKFAICLIATT